ncbi:MAG: hypothetical protein RIQ60_63 [Pseudomonadota bacterium]|jgi:hypothetical protein
MAQASLNLDLDFSAATPAGADTLELAREIGRDHACHGLRPPAELLLAHPALRSGWDAGRASFAARSRVATPQVQQWLALRLQAWQEERHFELLNVTPHYLGQISGMPVCPVVRSRFDAQPGGGSVDRSMAASLDGWGELSGARPAAALPAADAAAPAQRQANAHRARVVRVCEDAAYAAGNLVCLSRLAADAKSGLDWQAALHRANTLRGQAGRQDGQGGGPGARQGGLGSTAWGRLGVLMSFVTPLAHERAARLPLLVLPPNRLRLLNPVQGLQAYATLLLAHSGWSQRLPAFEALLPSESTRREFKRFFMRLLTQALAHGRPDQPQSWRWALEDAWRDAQVQQLWTGFALQLGPICCERVLDAAARLGLKGQRLVVHSVEQATEGWSLATHGYCLPVDGAAADPSSAPLRRLSSAARRSLGTPALAMCPVRVRPQDLILRQGLLPTLADHAAPLPAPTSSPAPRALDRNRTIDP